MRAEEAFAVSQRVDPYKARASLMELLNYISSMAALGHTSCKSYTYLIEDKTLNQLRALGYRVEAGHTWDEDDIIHYYNINWEPPKPISRPHRQTILGKVITSNDD